MSLKELQRDFLHAYLNDDTQALNHQIKTTPQLSADQRLSIYHGSMTETLANALRESYPACQRLVGDDFFSGLAYQYAANTPATTPNLFDYGDQFADFVADFPPCASFAYLSDVCRLEWAWQCAYYSIDAPTIDAEQLNLLNENEQARLTFTLPPGATLLSSDYPIHDIWQYNRHERTEEKIIDLATGGCKLLIHRPQQYCHATVLTEEEWSLLSAFQRQETLAQISEESELLALLPRCISERWVCAFSLAKQ